MSHSKNRKKHGHTEAGEHVNVIELLNLSGKLICKIKYFALT